MIDRYHLHELIMITLDISFLDERTIYIQHYIKVVSFCDTFCDLC